MVQISTPRGPLHVVVKGEGEPLLLIHGFPLDHRMWSAQIEHFSKEFQVLAPDLRGLPASRGPASVLRSCPDSPPLAPKRSGA